MNSAPRWTRFIPTCVGNTPQKSAMAAKLSVHPHVRGEYYPTPVFYLLSIGSSPRAWGIQWGQKKRVLGRRFIPTCVGNTTPLRHRLRTHSVHPHVRGEYACRTFHFVPCSGSSPRAWGIRHDLSSSCGTLRFIPTCVGNTQRDRNMLGRYRGSSPRAWGIQCLHFYSGS